jgi:hypothetical protein
MIIAEVYSGQEESRLIELIELIWFIGLIGLIEPMGGLWEVYGTKFLWTNHCMTTIMTVSGMNPLQRREGTDHQSGASKTLGDSIFTILPSLLA